MPPIADGTLRGQFHADFAILTGGTPEHIREALRIRHQVYCVENSFETKAGGAHGIETDQFDSHATHARLICRHTGVTLGTVRLVLPLADAAERSFPLQRFLDAQSAKQLRSLPRLSTAEISCFGISRHSRSLMRKAAASGTQAADVPTGPLRFPAAARAHAGAWADGQESWDHPLLRADGADIAAHARSDGDTLPPDREAVGFHGLRQPCYVDIAEMSEEVRRERPSFWDILSDGGLLAPAPRLLRAVN